MTDAMFTILDEFAKRLHDWCDERGLPLPDVTLTFPSPVARVEVAASMRSGAPHPFLHESTGEPRAIRTEGITFRVAAPLASRSVRSATRYSFIQAFVDHERGDAEAKQP